MGISSFVRDYISAYSQVTMYDSPPVPKGLSWITDTIRDFDIYKFGFVERPTIYFDPNATSSREDGSFYNPIYQASTLAKVINGNMAGTVLGFKRGTTLRVPAGLGLNVYGTSSSPFLIVPYGDSYALPIITGATIVTTWTLYDSVNNIWAYTTATEYDVWDNGVRMQKLVYATSPAATLTTNGTSTYSGGVLYIRPFGTGENANGGQMEINSAITTLSVNYGDVADSGYIQIAGLDVRKSQSNVFAISAATTANITNLSSITVVGCSISGGGVDTSTSYGRDGFLLYGAGGSAQGSATPRLSGAYVAGNYSFDNLNNAFEFAGTTGLIHEYNYGYNVGGNSISEMWASNDTAIIRYNYGYLSTAQNRINKGGSQSGVWFANYYYSSGSWDTVDTTNAQNHTNSVYMNLIVAPGSHAIRATGGTGHTAYQNTLVMDSDLAQIAAPLCADGLYTDGTASTGFLTFSNNLVYYIKGTQAARYPHFVYINAGLGSANSVPSGNNNCYVQLWGNGDGNWQYAGSSTGNFRTYQSTVAAYSLDQNSLTTTDQSGTIAPSSVGFDETNYHPLTGSPLIGAGLTGLSVGTKYKDGRYYTNATPTIGCYDALP